MNLCLGDWNSWLEILILKLLFFIPSDLAPQAQQHAEEARNIMLRVVQAGGAQQDRKHIYR